MFTLCTGSRRPLEVETRRCPPHFLVTLQNISSISESNTRALRVTTMALRTILEYPDPRLRTKARPVTEFGEPLQRLVEDLFDPMYAAPGIGLAATQIDAHERVIVADVSPERDQPLVLINPLILTREGEATVEEGCLSVPEIFDDVTHAAHGRGPA